MNETVLILAAALALIYAAFSRLAAKSIVTPPIAFHPARFEFTGNLK